MYLIFVHGFWLKAPKALETSWDKGDKGDFYCFNMVNSWKALREPNEEGWLGLEAWNFQ